jgi:multidrug efflux system membrane fusion protein
LQDTVVHAPQEGRVTGLSVLAGEVVIPNQSLFLLVHTGEWFAVANFRETSLADIHIGDCATVYSMIDRRKAIRGTVTGIGRASPIRNGSTCRARCPACRPR